MLCSSAIIAPLNESFNEKCRRTGVTLEVKIDNEPWRPVCWKAGRGAAAPIGPQRRSLWGLRFKIAHVLGFPTRIARSRSPSKGGRGRG